jgi:hypothetical protein
MVQTSPTGSQGDHEGKESMKVQVKLIKVSVCLCGFRIVNDDVPLGKVYTIDLSRLHDAVGTGVMCGGCGKRIETSLVWTEDAEKPGYLPREIFEEIG